ncbi:MAG: bifunctional methylenetetrahydrofolate dehydrogenase/methenyltetrahydrofolate cyclohydrolase FolD [Promethearchaeota archaeon]
MDMEKKESLILDGKKLAEELNNTLKVKIANAIEIYGRPPGLATILVGDDPASKVYVGMKVKTCQKLGIKSEDIRLPKDIPKQDLIRIIKELNKKEDIDGILLQLPLPEHLKGYTNEILDFIDDNKDVDGFSARNMGNIILGKEDLASCTPKGIIRILEKNNIQIQGSDVVIVNHSNIIGKPLALMLLNRNATVSVCHIYTKDIEAYLKRADILVVGVGKINFITAEKIKEGVVIVDAGINRDENHKLCGDVDFSGVINKVKAITPVPGGVGPMTIAMLMENTYNSYLNRIKEYNIKKQ